MQRITTNAALLIDAAGCFAASSLFLISATAWDWTDLPANWRQPVVVTLFLLSVLLVVAARYQTRLLIALAVLGNIAWVTGGAIALFVTGTLLGGILIGGVMVLDAAMAWLQSRPLRPNSEALHTTTEI